MALLPTTRTGLPPNAPYPGALIAVMGFLDEDLGLWELRFGLSLWGSISLRVQILNPKP